jgi:hypothetical protein
MFIKTIPVSVFIMQLNGVLVDVLVEVLVDVLVVMIGPFKRNHYIYSDRFCAH